MLDIKRIRDDFAAVEAALARRGKDYGLDLLREEDVRRRELVGRTEALQKERNDLSRQVGQIKKEGGDAESLQARVRGIADEARELEALLKEIDERVADRLLTIPNLPHPAVPDGAFEADNVEIRRWGTPRTFAFTPKPHHEVGEALGILDLKRAAKLSGARFSLQFGDGARLERALINFMLDLHTGAHGYTETLAPYMVSSETMRGTGQLPKFKEDLFKIEGADYWLIPTAEVPVTNIYAGEILDGADLPKAFVAFTPCFRAEAGSYGRDTTGLIRQHQFHKVELVRIVRPEESDAALEALTGHAEKVLQLLGLPYRVMALCAGDLGFSAARTYDLEVWVPSQEKYREISSCSVFTDYQSRRMNLRFRREPKGKPEFPHTLNGSGLAVGRTLVAILENFQNADGTVTIPEVLRPSMGGRTVISG
ncbi:MAG: serine--tRNA ligase [Nitrospinae bacterium]|nr:serine--tRNA ligase [Nitrospinota bacterium]